MGGHCSLSILVMLVVVSWRCVIVVSSVPIVINCGNDKVETDGDGRKWEADSKYLQSPAKEISSSTAEYQDPSLPSPVPYMTARIIPKGAQATYKFPTKTDTRYYLRLHFYPEYQDPANAYLTATANGATLLNNFSASITAQALTQSYIIREFNLAPSDDPLTLQLKPTEKMKDAFAFINGIEVVEVVEGESLFDMADMVGFMDQTVDEKSVSLETMVRLNMGGSFVSPTNDSDGMLRTWYDDTPYLAGANSGVTSTVSGDGKNATVNYRKPGGKGEGVTEAAAPADVYRTWRSMGPDPKLTVVYNLTWDFQVDPNFTYVVRMHFCEERYTQPNQRVFFIYLNNQSALPDNAGADVIVWSGGKGVPIYKDFAIFVKNQNTISLALHPYDSGEFKPEYYDAILNGLEIFKVADISSNLAGPNPTISPAMLKAEEKAAERNFNDKNDNNNHEIKVIGAASGAAVFGLAAVVGIAAYQKKKKQYPPRTKSGTVSWLPIVGNSHTGSKSNTVTSGTSMASAQLSTEAAANCRYFSLTDIKKATKSFDPSHVIGVGGFGKVYRGVIDGGVKVAIKRSNPDSEQGVHEFVTEIEMLSKLRHKHLVSLIGYCEEEGEMALVYDYMEHGTLREHLYKGNKITLTWKQRLEILIGSAKGLHYLHTGAKYTIIHRDVKTTNILLDDNWVAKVSDFGLSKTGPEVNMQSHVSTVVKGSFGYLDPEYFKRQQLTEKSDVYSFGVVIFEVLSARPALNPSLPKEQVSLADWALQCVRKDKIDDLIDTHIKGTIHPECLNKIVETATKCLSDHGVNRPSMSDLLWNLEFAMQIQVGKSNNNNNNQNKKDLPTTEGFPMQPKSSINMHLSTLSLGEDDLNEMNFNPTSDDSDNAVFSQIVHQTGR